MWYSYIEFRNRRNSVPITRYNQIWCSYIEFRNRRIPILLLDITNIRCPDLTVMDCSSIANIPSWDIVQCARGDPATVRHFCPKMSTLSCNIVQCARGDPTTIRHFCHKITRLIHASYKSIEQAYQIKSMHIITISMWFRETQVYHTRVVLPVPHWLIPFFYCSSDDVPVWKFNVSQSGNDNINNTI